MNIDEERKAFEIAACALILKDRPDSGLTVEEIYTQRDGDTYISSSWAFGWWSWLAAKAHAEEMAKPICRIVNLHPTKERDYWSMIVLNDRSKSRSGFDDEKMAREFAVLKGYRVVEE